MTHTPFHYLGLLTTIILAIALLIRLFAPKGWYLRGGVAFLLGPGLKNAIQKLLEELPGKVQKETIAEVATHVIWRLTRVGVFAMILGLVPFILLWQQNRLLQQQNERIYQQTFLIEGQRRSSLIFMMSNIMDKVDEEIKSDFDNDGRRNLSFELIGRISALSHAFKPYRYLENGKLSLKELSPERGQLLLALLKTNLTNETLDEIYKDATFEKADLEQVRLDGEYLTGINLKEANLRKAFLEDAILARANLHRADLWDAHMPRAILFQSILSEAVLSHVELWDVDLSEASLSGARLNGTEFHRAILTGTRFGNSNLSKSEGLNIDQLVKANNLYLTIGIPDTLRNQILQQKPELLEKPENMK